MHTQSHTTQQYFHCYATANDKCHYFNDIQNLMRISRFYSGVDKVSLFIAISQVHNVNFVDKLFVKSRIQVINATFPSLLIACKNT